jgi:molecular chaperone DnaK
VRKRLADQTNIPINFSIDPTNSVAVGAAYYAANKYYEPTEKDAGTDGEKVADDLLASVDFDPIDLDVQVSYNRSSRDKEEVLLMAIKGDYEHKYYRIIRSDGGFDTGLVSLRAKISEFLPLIPAVNNLYQLHLYDAEKNELKKFTREFLI